MNAFTHPTGFDQGGWLPPWVDQDFGEIMEAWFARADEFLLGRTTYEMMFPYWSQLIVTDPDEAGVTGQQLNNLPKHIVSRTLRSPEWANSSVVDGEVVAAVKALKAKPGRELQVHGSAQLVQTLNQHYLVDEYRLLVFPVVLGTGKRLFGDGTVPTAFKTVQNRTTSTGVVALTLCPTGTPPRARSATTQRRLGNALTPSARPPAWRSPRLGTPVWRACRSTPPAAASRPVTPQGVSCK